ncbi:uncharacterized protein [Parasteatoda tepidariorum]|uniref:uncharacterized protein n=1 Tax=Parasteatoda tepidariorum TaxID=114398 RepID=UPI0039BC3D4D
MVGWILRFLENCKLSEKDRKKGGLTLAEVENAEIKLIKVIQNEAFTADYIKSLKSLNVFKDEKGIYRIKTKLTERNDTENFRLPILLPEKLMLVDMIIKEKHSKCLHAGLQILLFNLRENYWIINGRRAVRRILKTCVRCKRYNARSIKTVPVGLPEDRVKEVSVFEVVGIDLAGPLHLKEGAKSWIVIYTCAVYRSIHLELVQSLSTKTFLLSLRRFIARRGRPHIIYCDNGSIFIGAENLLQSLDWKSIEAETSVYKIEWKFNPPSAPWRGGFWEIMGKLVKNILRKFLGKACLSYEEMCSVLCDCESVINSRPLTYLSEDLDDLIPLSPSMFLQEISTVGVPDLDQLDTIDLKKRYRYQQTLREQLRKRFRCEYLATLLQPRKKNNYYDLKVGKIVLIEDDLKKRLHWPMAKVITVYPGKDKRIRVARLKTAHTEFLMPVQRIYPLEIRSTPNEGSTPNEKRNFK